MSAIIPFLVAALLIVALSYARKGGLGEMGRRIRNSDRWALEDAIAQKEHELEELKALRPKYPYAVKP